MTYVERSDEEFIKAFEQWVAEHPKSDQPTITSGSKDYSPKKILREAKQQPPTEFAQMLLDFLRDAGKRFDKDPLDFIYQTIENNKKIS